MCVGLWGWVAPLLILKRWLFFIFCLLIGGNSGVITGVEMVDKNRNVKVYPNPFSNNLNIETEGNNGKQNLEILNPIGQVIYNDNFIEKTTIQSSNFAPGVYLIKLANGKTFEFKKIIKE